MVTESYTAAILEAADISMDAATYLAEFADGARPADNLCPESMDDRLVALRAAIWRAAGRTPLSRSMRDLGAANVEAFVAVPTVSSRPPKGGRP